MGDFSVLRMMYTIAMWFSLAVMSLATGLYGFFPGPAGQLSMLGALSLMVVPFVAMGIILATFMRRKEVSFALASLVVLCILLSSLFLSS